jgi:hypothetical protein
MLPTLKELIIASFDNPGVSPDQESTVTFRENLSFVAPS